MLHNEHHLPPPPYELLYWFSFFSSPLCSCGTHSKCRLSYRPPVPAAILVFTRPLPARRRRRGDAAVTCQFPGGDAHWPVGAQNRIVRDCFRCECGEHNADASQRDEQLKTGGRRRKKNDHPERRGNVAFVRSEVTGGRLSRRLTAPGERDCAPGVRVRPEVAGHTLAALRTLKLFCLLVEL